MSDQPFTMAHYDLDRDPHRVDPARHRGDDIGILNRSFELPRDRRPDDPAGPRRLDPDDTERGPR